MRESILVYLSKPTATCFVCFFDLILYTTVNNLSVMLGQVFLCGTSTKQGFIFLAQEHNAVKHSTTEPLLSHI